MKKRILSLLLMLALLLTLLPAAALAAGSLPPAETAYWDNLTLQEAQSVVSSITGKTADTDIVLIYYKLSGCWNSATYVPEFAEYVNANRIEVCAYAYNPDAVSGDGISLSAIFGLLGGTSLTFPVVVTYNAATGQYQAADKVLGVDAFRAQLSASGLYDDSDDPGSGDMDNPSDSDSSLTLYYDDSIDSAAWEVLRLTNQHRMSMGLAPLSTTDAMQMAANQRAEELTVQYNSDHSRPDGSECFTVFTDYGIAYNIAAENIAYGYPTAASVVNGWLNSSGHRANMENASLVHMGVGHAANYWSQNFAGSSSCSYSGLSLSRSGVTGTVGQDLEDILTEADITVTADCAKHGESYLPLIAAMCSGYDADAAGTQTVTVSLEGQSTALTVTLTAAPGSDSGQTADTPTIQRPAEPSQPEEPVQPEEPSRPVEPSQPVEPSRPAEPSQPAEPSRPTQPEQPAIPQRPTALTLPFQDVANHWALESIAYVYENNLFSGTSATAFDPDARMTRAMVVTVLARYAGVDTGGGSTWYSTGRTWAMAMGVSDGTDMMGFITREQLATMLYRYAGSPAAAGSLSRFPDAAQVSGYAEAAMCWAVSTGLITGMDDGSLNPQGDATRAQVATIMMRFCEG